MAVKSTPFGAVVLSGDDARKFRLQVTHGRPKKAAFESMAKGDAMRVDVQKTGRVIVRARATTTR